MPDGWREVVLGDIAEVNPERTPAWPPEKLIRYVDLSSVSEAVGIDQSLLSTFRYDQAPGRARRLIRAGDVLVATVRPYLRGFAVVPPELDGNVASTGFAVLRARKGRALPQFLWAVVRTEAFVEGLMRRATGSNYPAVRPEDVAAQSVLLPPLAEQRRIVDLVDTLDHAVRAATTVSASARLAYEALATAMFASDERVPLGAIVEIRMGRQRSPSNASGPDMVPYMRAANVKDGVLQLDDILHMNFGPREQRAFALEVGDVLVTEGCGSLGELGASAFWQGELPGITCFQNTVIRLRARPGVTTPGYVHHLARHAHHSGWWAAIASGTNIYHIGSRRAAVMEVPLLNLAAQKGLVQVLDEADHLAAAADAVLGRLKDLHSSLLHGLLSGERQIPESYDRFLGGAA